MKKNFMMMLVIILILPVLSYAKTENFEFNIKTDKLDFIDELSTDVFDVQSKNLNFYPDSILNSQLVYIFAVSESSNIRFIPGSYDIINYNNFDLIGKYERNDEFEIIDLGSYRGIKLKKVIINPFYYQPLEDNIKVLTSGRIIVENDLNKSKTFMSLTDLKFIDNYYQIPYLPKSYLKFQENYNKFDLTKNYVKISVNKDKIYKISFDMLKEKNPDIIGKSIENIRLINNGEDIPLYIKSTDNISSVDDYLYFYGKHRRSDTTYYNFYGNDNPYFLFYDPEIKGKKLNLSDITGEYNKVEDVYAKIHFEKEKVYNYYALSSEEYPNEGWYWGEVIADENYNPKTSFTTNLFLSPSEVVNNNLDISVVYKSYNDLVFSQPYKKYFTYDIQLFLNNYAYQREKFSGFKFDTLKAEVNYETVNYGLNEFKIGTQVTDPETDNYTGIDFIEVKGYMKPQAIEQKLEFYKKYKSIAYYEIPNFKNTEVALINEESNQITFPELVAGYNFNIGIHKDNGVSIAINDKFYFSYNFGFHIIYLENNELKSKYSENNTDELNNLIQNFTSNTPFIISVNNVSSIPGNIKSTLEGLGASKLNSYNNGMIYVFGGVKGNSQNIEQIDNNRINLNRFISNTSSDHALAKFNTGADNTEKLFISNVETNDFILSSINNDNLYESEQIDYLIISHPNFIEGVKRLAEHRKNTLGIQYRIVNTDDVYDQFNNGIKSAFAIKNYLKYIFANYPDNLPSDVLLVGDATWDPNHYLTQSVGQNFLPSYGMPVSDFWYTLIVGDDLIPDINLGRLPVNDDTELNNMIDKMIDYDNVPLRSWMKEMLFMSGGIGEDQIRQFKNRIPWVKDDIFEAEPMGGKGTTISKSSNAASGEEQAGIIREEINKGKIWTNFLGHASAEIFDMDGWQVETLNNKDRYGILTTLSCNTGAFAEPPIKNCRNETYIKAKDKGFLATISGTAAGSVSHQWYFFTEMVTAFSDSSLKMRRIGDILTYSRIKSANNDDPINIMTRYHINLLGDPLTSLRINDGLDLFLDKFEITVANENGSEIFSEEDSTIVIKGFVNNNGYCTDEHFRVSVIRNAVDFDYSDTTYVDYYDLCFREDFEVHIPILNMTGDHNIQIIIDNEYVTDDKVRSNNIYNTNVDILTKSLICLEPNDAGIINSDESVFRFINPLSNSDDINYHFYITKEKYDEESLVESTENNIFVKENNIDWKPDLSVLNVDEEYWLKAGYSNNNIDAKWIWVNFNLESGSINNSTKWANSSSNQFREFIDRDSIIINDDDYDKLTIESDTIPYHLLSHIGKYNADPSIKSWVNIEVGNDVYVSSEYAIGFNIALIPVDISEGKGKYVRFDTWGNDDSYTPEFWKDSSAVRLVKFLQDSIPDDNYVLLTTCRPSFRLPTLHHDRQPESTGNLDSLVEALKLYGSKLSDKFTDDIQKLNDSAAYQLVSRYGYDDPIENLIFEKDSLVTEGNIIRHKYHGSMITKEIGPAKTWMQLNVSGNINMHQNAKIEVYGINSENEEHMLKESAKIGNIDISDISTSEYQYIKIKIGLDINTFQFNSLFSIDKPDITSISVDYVPVPEIALIKSQTYLNKDSVLKGEPLYYNYKIENLSLRADAQNFSIDHNATKELGEILLDSSEEVDFLKADSTLEESILVPTEFIDNLNFISSFINADNINDIYNFNNSSLHKFYRTLDTVKPSIRIKADGKYLQPNDYVSSKPEFEIELYDNGFVKITDSTKIAARLNGYYHPGNNTEFAKFETYSDSSLKAKLTFIPDTIEYEDILLIAYVSDAENNRDTLKMYLKTSLKNSFTEDHLAIPNPFEDDVNINFVMAMPYKSADAEVKIYNAIGQLVSTIDGTVQPGVNNIYWNGRDDNNAPVPIGTYYYRIDMFNAGYIEPIYGRVAKIK